MEPTSKTVWERLDKDEIKKPSKRPSDATGEMAIMGKEGDTKLFWNVKSWDEVQMAKETFDRYRAKGFAAFNMTKKGQADGEIIREFDPSVGRILFLPQMAGG